jgi:HEAT repeat protein
MSGARHVSQWSVDGCSARRHPRVSFLLSLSFAIAIVAPVSFAGQPAVDKPKGATTDEVEPGTAEWVDALRKNLYSPDASLRRRSAEEISKIGPAARAAIPDLVSAILRNDTSLAGHALIGIGRESIPAVLDALAAAKDNSNARSSFYFVLGSLYKEGDAEIERVICRAIKEERPDTLRCSAMSWSHENGPISTGRPPVQGAARMLIEVLRDSNEPVDMRDWAALNVGYFGAEARPILPLLRQTFDDPKAGEDSRRFALLSIGRLNVDDRGTAQFLRTVFKNEKEPSKIRGDAVECLGRSRFTSIATDDMLELLRKRPDGRLDYLYDQTVASLMKIDLPKDAASLLVDLIEDDRFQFRGPGRIALVQAVGRIGPSAKAEISRLMAKLKEDPYSLSERGLEPCVSMLIAVVGRTAAIAELRAIAAHHGLDRREPIPMKIRELESLKD